MAAINHNQFIQNAQNHEEQTNLIPVEQLRE